MTQGWHFLLCLLYLLLNFFTQLLKVIWNHDNSILQAVKSDRSYTRKILRNILTWIISGFLHFTSQDKILDKCQRNYVAVCYWWSIGWYSLFWKVIMMRKPYFKGHSCAVTARVSEKCWQWPDQLKRQRKDKLPEIEVTLIKILTKKTPGSSTNTDSDILKHLMHICCFVT